MNESDASSENGGYYRAVRIGDTAEWRLLVSVSATGIGAWLKHDDPTRPIETLFEETWKADGALLLSRIEGAVYDHPQVLDDFSADITLTAPESIWVPSSLVTDDYEEAHRLFNQVYEARPADVMAETVDDAACLYTLVPGLRAFLSRTFPGARVHSHLAVLVRRFRERSADMPRVYIDIRDGEADYVAFDRRNLLMAATHRWHFPEDIRYHLFNILNVFGLDPQQTQVSVSGPANMKTELVRELRKSVAYVMLTMIPTLGLKAELPLATSLLLRR